MKRVLLLCVAVIVSVSAFAQKSVTGKVTTSDGSPAAFANVVVKGTTNGAITNELGEYTLNNVKGDAVLQISSIGFKSLETPVGGRSVIDIVLEADAQLLEDVMVVAYGTVKKGSYSGSAAVVKQDAMKDAPVVSFEQVLSGKAPGVQVASYSGQPGSEVEINIRGFGSFNASNQPLYVIDGVPATSGDYSSGNISTSSMNFLNPSDVESITILKDAAAASLYGSRASNGVILITTKKGKAGKVVSTFKASVGISSFAYDNYPLASEEENIRLHTEAWTNYGNDNPARWNKSYATLNEYVQDKVKQYYPDKDESKYIYKDWKDVLFTTGVSQNYEFSIAGGNDKSKVFASMAYLDNQGVVKINYLRRFSTTINAEHAVNNWLKVGGTVQYSWQYQSGNQDGWSSKDNPFFIWKVVLFDRWPYAYKSDGSLYLGRFNSGLQTINPVQSYDAQLNDAWQNRLILKGWAEVKFTDWLSAKTIVSSDWLYVHDRFGWLYGHPNFYAYSEQGGYMSDRHRNVNRMVSSSTLNFNKSFGNHNVSAMVGWEAERERYKHTRIGKVDFSYMGATESVLASTFDDGYSYSRESGLLSFLSSVNYDYNGKYFITGTFRRDASSKLSKETRWGNFWSVSGSWKFSNENFAKELPWLNDGKIRGSYGTSGTLPSNYFGYMATYNYTKYGDGGASYPSNVANTELTWEKNKNWNIGLDLTIFDRYTISAEYFSKKTTDLLLDATIPSTTGFTTTLMNVGSMTNRGVELSLNVNIIDKKDMSLSFGANWSTVKNKINALSVEGEEQVPNSRTIWKEGYSFYQYYVRNYLGIAQETFTDLYGNTIKAGDPIYAEGSFYKAGITDEEVVLKDGTVIKPGENVPYDTYNYSPTRRQSASRMILDGKTAIPKGYGGFNLDFRWKDISFSMSWAYKYGHYICDEGIEQLGSDGYYYFHRGILSSQTDTWSETNPDGSVPRRVADNSQGGYYYSSRYLKKGDYLRLKNATVSYNLPKNWVNKMRMQNVRVYVAGSNLLTFSGLDIDPEIQSNGYYNWSMPALRTITFGLELTL